MSLPFPRTLRALEADRGGVAWLAAGLAGLGLAAWCTWLFAAQVTLREASPHARLEVAAPRHVVVAPSAGTLLRALPELGREVKAGELLAELAPEGLLAQRREAAARQQALRPRLAALQAEAAQLQAMALAEAQADEAARVAAAARTGEADAGVDLAADQARRYEAERGSGSVAEADVARAGVDLRRLREARRALEAEQQRGEAEARARRLQRAARRDQLAGQLGGLQGELDAAGAVLERLEAELERLRLRAPADGRVAERADLGRGAGVAAGQALATVVPNVPGLRVVADFDPRSALGRLRPGQLARLQLDAFPPPAYPRLAAEVLRVAHEPRDQRLRVEFALRGEPPPGLALQHGLSGRIEVDLEARSPAHWLLRSLGRAAGAAS